MRIENCVPMIALCLLLCGCGKQTAEPAADLRSVYQEMSGCEMTAEVTCEQSGLEWSATLHGTYVPGGESTVEVLEPLELAGVRAVIREDLYPLSDPNVPQVAADRTVTIALEIGTFQNQSCHSSSSSQASRTRCSSEMRPLVFRTFWTLSARRRRRSSPLN